MKKQLLLLLFLSLATGYGYSQTVVKMLLPDNCEANTTEVEHLKIEENTKLVIFPNPNLGEFTLYADFSENIKKATIEVYNTSGTLMYSEEVFCDSPKLVKKLSISHLSSGNYIVRFRTETRVLSTKLLIK